MAMNNELLAVVGYIERERGVDREIVLTAIESALQQSARHNPGVTNDLRVVIDRKTLNIHVYDTLVVSNEDTATGYISVNRARRFKPDVQEGEAIEIEMPAARLGRIVAQTSRQMIMQKIREAERTNTFSEFRSRIGEIVSGTISSINHKDLYVTVGKTEMFLPGKERIPTEDFRVGDTIKAIVKDVRQDQNGPMVTLSRTSNDFLRMLFTLEVSEISEGVVEIMGVSRDPGYRSKLAVRTHDEKVDPVGACVGLKGARVRNIVRELCGEKIDIVRWSEDVKNYVTQALAPAKLETVEFDSSNSNAIHVTVAPDQYSLAIGKRGQNVRLTSRLIGWHLDVKKVMMLASFEEQRAEAIRNLADTFSVSSAVATQLAEAGFLSIEGIVECGEEEFVASVGLDEVTARGLYAAAITVADLMGLKRNPEQNTADSELGQEQK